MKRSGLIAAIIVTAIMVTAAGSAWSFHGGDSGEGGPFKKLLTGHMGRLLVLKSKLDITDEQREKIKGIVKSRKGEIAPVVKDLMEKRYRLRKAVLDEPANEAEIRAAAKSLSGSIGDAAVVAAKVIADARPVLSPKQRKLLREFRSDMRAGTMEWLNDLTGK